MSFLERGIPIFSNQVEASALPQILSRFKEENRRVALQRGVEASSLIRVLRQAQNLRFVPENYPPNHEELPQCPQFGLVYAGALLTGRTTPSDLEELNRLFCGQTLESIDNMGQLGPLSGARGTNYIPFSQCWRVATELKKLAEFMRVREDMPELLPTGDEEVKIRKLLNERDRIRTANQRRGFVIVTWKYLRDRLPFGVGGTEQPLLGTGPSRTNESRTLVRVVFDASLQFDLGGDEYNAIVSWAERNILDPLLKLVGKDNVSPIKELKNGGLSLRLGTQKTAENCSRAPRRSFMGRLSAV